MRSDGGKTWTIWCHLSRRLKLFRLCGRGHFLCFGQAALYVQIPYKYYALGFRRENVILMAMTSSSDQTGSDYGVVQF